MITKTHIQAIVMLLIVILLVNIFFQLQSPIRYVGGLGFIMIGWFIAGYYDRGEKLEK